MAKSKFFRVAVEGATVDGRVIQREWLEQMAASYDPATYTARINCEHIAGYSPDRPFNAYGSVLSLKTEEIELIINGEEKTLLALYAEIDANDQLVEINKAGQKLFTSCEIHPDFAGEGKAYLVGLAVTDMPASLGTEALKFAVKSRANVFSTAHETEIELVAALPPDAATIAEGAKAGFLSAFATLFKAPPPKENPAPPQQPPANDNFDVERFSISIPRAPATRSPASRPIWLRSRASWKPHRTRRPSSARPPPAAPAASRPTADPPAPHPARLAPVPLGANAHA